MIRADHLRGMIESAAKVLGKADQQVVGIRVEDGVIETFTTGQTSAIRMRGHLEGVKRPENFTCAVDCETVTKILGGCGASEVEIGLAGEAFYIRGLVNAEVPTFARNPEIRIETNTKFKVNAEWFRRCCILTGKFCSKEKGRYALNTGRFEFSKDKATFVSTDGRKGVFSDEKAELAQGQWDVSVNLPKESMQAMAYSLPPTANIPALVSIGPSGFKVEVGDVTYWCVQAEGEFPGQWRDVFPAAESIAPVDGKHLSKFSSIMDSLEVDKARFVASGTSLKIYGRSAKVPAIDTQLDLSISPCEMLLSPELLAGSVFDNGVFQFGWGRTSKDGDLDAAVFVSQPFTAFALSCVE